MNDPRPLSAQNPRVRRLTRLVRRRRERVEQRALVVEGPVLIGEALDRGVSIQEVFVDEDRCADPAIRNLLRRLPDGIDGPWSLPTGTLDRVGDAATSQGVLAIAERTEGVLPAVPTGFVPVLVDIADPGNAGTLIRAAVASGAAAVVLIGGVDVTNPKVIRASAGTLFGIPLVERDEVGALDELRTLGYRLLGAVPRGGIPHTEAPFEQPSAIVLGNEARGLDDPTLAQLDRSVTIDMAGPAESLNVAMAGTILFFEALRRGASAA